MKKYLVVYMAPIAAIQEMMANSTDEEKKAGMEKWNQWMSAHQDSMTDKGGPLGKNMRVTKDGATAVSNDMTGYSIFQAESQEAAAALFKADHPAFDMPGTYVEVMEVIDMSPKQ